MRCEFPGELVKMERFRDLGGREVAGVSEIWEILVRYWSLRFHFQT